MDLDYKLIDDTLVVSGLVDFSLDQIFTCGQCFRWIKNDGWYDGIAYGKYASFRQKDNVLYAKYVTKEDFESFWYDYFDLGRDYGRIKSELAKKDELMKQAVAFGEGIRILRQEPFETLISFIISANNNIPRIKKCVENLCRDFGEPVYYDGVIKGYSFPTPMSLSQKTPEDISVSCHAGYRCPYIVSASSQYLSKSIDPVFLNNMSYADSKKTVMQYMGVGPKVADCILLFTGSKADAFPVDVWIKKVLNKHYFPDVTDRKKLEKLAGDYFGEYAGIAQQYLFFFGRENDLLVFF